MKWFLGTLLVLAAVLLLVVVIGAVLPRKHRATRQARFTASPAALFARIAGPPDWRPEVKSWEPLADVNGRRRWREINGWGDAILYEAVESVAPRLHRTRIADETLPYGGGWTIELTPAAAGGTTVRITEDGEVHNVVFRFLSKFVFGHTRTIDGYLQALGHAVGENITIQ